MGKRKSWTQRGKLQHWKDEAKSTAPFETVGSGIKFYEDTLNLNFLDGPGNHPEANLIWIFPVRLDVSSENRLFLKDSVSLRTKLRMD